MLSTKQRRKHMFKLFINNLQVGNYKTYHDLAKSLVMNYCVGKQCTSFKNTGNSTYVKFAD